METQIIAGEAGVKQAIALLKEGAVVALPTETVYGLAGDAFSPQSIASIFEAKKRPLTDPLIVHLLEPSWVDRVAIIPPELKETVSQLMQHFWPGPMTLLLPRKETIPDLITAGLDTVALRVPEHPLFREILGELDTPLAAPSANRFGRISPTTATDVLRELNHAIPLILDGDACHHGLESTIIWPHDGVLQILRPGPITIEQLASFGTVLAQPIAGKAPGSLESHYAPRKKLSWYNPTQPLQQGCGFLAFSQAPPECSFVEILSPSGNLKEAAANLYGALRRLDESEATSLIVEPMPEEGIGVAVMDRLKRAICR